MSRSTYGWGFTEGDYQKYPWAIRCDEIEEKFCEQIRELKQEIWRLKQEIQVKNHEHE